MCNLQLCIGNDNSCDTVVNAGPIVDITVAALQSLAAIDLGSICPNCKVTSLGNSLVEFQLLVSPDASVPANLSLAKPIAKASSASTSSQLSASGTAVVASLFPVYSG